MRTLYFGTLAEHSTLDAAITKVSVYVIASLPARTPQQRIYRLQDIGKRAWR